MKNVLFVLAIISNVAFATKLDEEMLTHVRSAIQMGRRTSGNSYEYETDKNERIKVILTHDQNKKSQVHASLTAAYKPSEQPMQKEIDKFRAKQIKKYWFFSVNSLETPHTKCFHLIKPGFTFMCQLDTDLDPETAKLLKERQEREKAKKPSIFKATFEALKCAAALWVGSYREHSSSKPSEKKQSSATPASATPAQEKEFERTYEKYYGWCN